MKKLLAVILIGTLFSCSPSTQIEKSWREPGSTYTKSPNNKVLVIAMVKDEAARRTIEDNIVKRIGTAVASYSAITAEMIKSAKEDDLTNFLKQGNYTHILLMRLADVEKETSYVPGSTGGYYGGYGRYYGYGAGYYSSPGYYTTDKNYFVETTIYSVNPDKLLWTCTTKTVNPSKVEKTIDEIATAITDKMKKDGFIPSK
ncbi:hypothetical protein [Flavihumibacter profundi]|jgi:hypothetical protein|uniref:hypothetical protein n=1 Tax=Flavihumibacter profundi TaxID=2716883 RepID=UPI001CC40789|nr:hypothetical protein [Flavihumibacter profundi]MBZ5856063.1 hypothetical protein [Flavihumibacter profundi]